MQNLQTTILPYPSLHKLVRRDPGRNRMLLKYTMIQLWVLSPSIFFIFLELLERTNLLFLRPIMITE